MTIRENQVIGQQDVHSDVEEANQSTTGSEETVRRTCLPAQRHIAVFFAVSGAALCLLLRFNLSIAIVDMTEQSNDTAQVPDFDWDVAMQGHILGAYFYSYTICNPLGGMLSDRYGPRWVMFFGNLIPAFLTLLTPAVVTWSTTAFIVLRVVSGGFHAFVIAAGYTLVSRWLPTREITFALGAIMAGVYLGIMAAMLLTGLICDSFGWEASFYILGIIPLLWCAAYVVLIYDSPETHPFISQAELNFLRRSGVCSKSSRSRNAEADLQLSSKWRSIMMSKPVWASIATKGCWNFGSYLIATKLPAYMHDVFGVTIAQNGFFSALPYLCCTISALFCSWLAQWLQAHDDWLSLLNIRRLMQTVANAGPALCVFLIPLIGTNAWIVECLLISSQVFSAFVAAGDNPNVADYAGPHYSGIIFGLTNAVGQAQGFIAPALVAPILGLFPEDLISGWNAIFYLSAAIYLIGNLIFCFLASAQEQDWAKISEPDEGQLSRRRRSRTTSPD